jgi:hypothetical protein
MLGRRNRNLEGTMSTRLKSYLFAVGLVLASAPGQATYGGSHKFWNWEGSRAYTLFGDDDVELSVTFFENTDCHQAAFVLLGRPTDRFHLTVDDERFVPARTVRVPEYGMSGVVLTPGALFALKHGHRATLGTDTVDLSINLGGSAAALNAAWENCTVAAGVRTPTQRTYKPNVAPRITPKKHKAIRPPRPSTASRYEIEDGVLVVEGEIRGGEFNHFRKAVEGNDVDWVIFDSAGGSVEDAIAMGQLIRERGMTVSLAEGGKCASACVFAYAGGVERFAHRSNSIGVHQVSVSHVATGARLPGSTADGQQTTAAIFNHFEAMGVNPKVAIIGAAVDPDDMHWFTQDQARDYGLVTAYYD